MKTSKYKNREAVKKHYYKNKVYYLAKNKLAKQRKYDYVIDLKTVTPCKDCKLFYPHYVLEFDHRDPYKKVDSISRLICNSWKKLKTEISKCDIVCSNCHSIRTYNRRVSGGTGYTLVLETSGRNAHAGSTPVLPTPI